MGRWVCQLCGCKYTPGAACCPACRATAHDEEQPAAVTEEDEVGKISRAGVVTSGSAVPAGVPAEAEPPEGTAAGAQEAPEAEAMAATEEAPPEPPAVPEPVPPAAPKAKAATPPPRARKAAS